MALTKCDGPHQYFVAETAATADAIHVLIVCVKCGSPMHHRFPIAEARLEADPAVQIN